MTEYDAFGRPIGEDPIAEQGWRRPGESGGIRQEWEEAAEAEVEAPPPPPTFATTADLPPPPAAPGYSDASTFAVPRTARRSGARGVVLAVAASMVILAAVGIFAAGSAVDDAVEAVDDFEALVPAVPDAETPAAAAPSSGLEGGSLVRRRNFAAALQAMRADGAERVMTLRVAPERIDYQVLLDGNRMRVAQVRPGGEVRTIATTPGAVPGTGVTLADVDPGAPERLVRAASRQARIPAQRIDYLVLLDLGGQLIWGAFFKDGAAHFQGDASGRILRRVS